MFCPVGYVLFGEVEMLLTDIVAKAVPFDKVEPLADVLLNRRALNAIALQEFLDGCPSLSLASPSGQIMRISSKIGKRYQEGTDSSSWAYINPESWQVDAAAFANRALSAQEEYPSLLENHDFFASGFEQKEERMAYLWDVLEDQKENAPTFLKFDGWTLTCKREDLPSAPTDFDCLKFTYGNVHQPKAMTSREIKASIIGKYDAGEPPVKKELWLELKADMKRAEFDAIWREAAALRPALSRPGRKPKIAFDIV